MSGTEPIIIEDVQLNITEARACYKAWDSLARLGGIQTYTLIGVLVASIVLAFVLESMPTGLWMTGTMVVLLTAMIISGKVMTSSYTRIVVDGARRVGPSRWHIDDAGFQVETPTGSVRVSWEGVVKVVEDTDRFFFAVSPAYNLVLPRRQMTETQIAALTTLVSEVTASGRLGAGVD